jgi:hypothetical protein
LKQQQETATQFLEGSVGFYLFERARPQKNTWHNGPLSLELEQIEEDYYRGEQQPPQCA